MENHRLLGDNAYICQDFTFILTPKRENSQLTEEERAANTSLSGGRVIIENVFGRPVHPPYFSVICTDCKANYEIPPMTSRLRISKAQKYEKSQSGFGDLVGKQT